MSAFALARLGIMPDDFGKMSYGYFTLLRREIDVQDIRHHYPAAAIQATLCNIKRDPEKMPEPFSAWDFIPGWIWKTEPSEEMAPLEVIAAIFGADLV